MIWDLRRADLDSTVLASGPPDTIGTMLPDHPHDTLDDTDWWLSTTTDLTEPTIVTFSGLSAPATVFVDGEPAATVKSTFLPIEVVMPAGRHRIDLRFESVTAWLKGRRPRGRWRSTLVAEQKLRWLRTSLIGRAPTYGGVPPIIGAWRPITFTTRAFRDVTVNAATATSTIEISGVVRAAAAIDDMPVDLRLETPDGHQLHTEATYGDNGFLTATFDVANPQLWYPNGYGPQPVYRLVFSCGDAVHRHLCGFRDVSVDTSDGGFALSVNGIHIFSRGVTWTPGDLSALDILADAGATMVRVVGGLVYESPEFFDRCAQLGLMVWQDAMVATFDPPVEHYPLIVDELATALRAVSGNPALAVVSGGSETIQQPEMMGVATDARRIELIESIFPEVVSSIARVPYVESSPSRGSADELAVRPDSGVAHWFGVGGYLRPLDDVHSAGVRFAAESLAFSIPPEPDAVERHYGTPAAAGHHPRWKAGVPRDRTASWDFEDVRDHYVREIFGVDPLLVRRDDPERYLHLGRLAVAEAMAHCYRFWRHPSSRCDGALVLDARDMRPGAGWGLIDVDGTAKLPLAVLRRLWAPRAVIARDQGLSGIAIDVHNDSPDPLSGTLRVRAVDSIGRPVVEGVYELKVEAHSSIRRHDAQITGTFADLSHAFRFGRAAADAVIATFVSVGGDVHTDVVVVAPRPDQVNSGLRAVAAQVDNEWHVHVESTTTLRYVYLDLPEWTLSDNVFHLAAGHPRVVIARPSGGRVTPAATPRGRVTSIDTPGVEAITIEETR